MVVSTFAGEEYVSARTARSFPHTRRTEQGVVVVFSRTTVTSWARRPSSVVVHIYVYSSCEFSSDVKVGLVHTSSFSAMDRRAKLAIATARAIEGPMGEQLHHLSCLSTLQRVPGIVYDTRHPRKKDGYRRRYP